MGPTGLNHPKSVSTPPPNSQSPASTAQGRPGFKPSIYMNPVVPSMPAPLNDPNGFLAPCPDRSPPSTTRKSSAVRLPIHVFFHYRLGLHGLLPVFPVRKFSVRP
jgi:hypothetical protein